MQARTYTRGSEPMLKVELLDDWLLAYILGDFNSRHPGPRHVWEGGPEPQYMTPDNYDPRASKSGT